MTCRENGLSKRFILGTAQLGMDYGSVVRRSLPSEDEVFKLLDYSWEQGIRWFDTAPAYGLAERRLGEWASRRGVEPNYVTKLWAWNPQASGLSASLHVGDSLQKSLDALKTHHITRLLVHRSDDLRQPLFQEAVLGLRDNPCVGGLGVSVYEPQQLRVALDIISDIRLVEAPVNLLDWRFMASTLQQELSDKKIELVARSVFLQGVLLTEPYELPDFFGPLVPKLHGLREIARRYNLTLPDLLLSTLLAAGGVSRVVVGISSLEELAFNLAAISADVPKEALDQAMSFATYQPIAQLDPRRWPQ